MNRCISQVFVPILAFLISAESRADAIGDASDIAAEWIKWCIETKTEMSNLHVFDTKAEHAKDVEKLSDVNFVKFDSLLIPVPSSQVADVTLDTSSRKNVSLKFTYESSLRITAYVQEPEYIGDVFDRFFIQLPDVVEDYISTTFGSSAGFTASQFQQNLSYFDLTMRGQKLATTDIKCDATSLVEDLVKIPSLLAAGSADYSASKSGKDVTYWSQNGMLGIISRQARRFSVGDENLRVFWRGDFQQGDSQYTVLMSFDAVDATRFDHLGGLLANPEGKASSEIVRSE